MVGQLQFITEKNNKKKINFENLCHLHFWYISKIIQAPYFIDQISIFDFQTRNVVRFVSLIDDIDYLQIFFHNYF